MCSIRSLLHISFYILAKKLNLVSSDQSTFFHMFTVSPIWGDTVIQLTLSLTFLVRSLNFMMLFAPKHSLNHPLRQSKSSCICTEIRLHTGELYVVISNHQATSEGNSLYLE
ncbi:hypothetical protein GOODEAATRI_006369 [Goodea atripinnis]|uniref:Uncharacterized protein n=1 Tax=Goodea atripinnis TaxID=208336 RepID=A0ABV0N180_9TELE